MPSRSLRVSTTSLALTALAGLVGVACGGNTQAQRDAAKKAADDYCACTLTLAKLPHEELAKQTMADLCSAQRDAWNSAWEGLPDRAAGDDKAMAISEYYGKCFSMMSDTYMAASSE